MEYHFVVVWSEENGWEVDLESTIARFRAANVYSHNLDEWLMPVADSETGDKEIKLCDELWDILSAHNASKNLSNDDQDN